MHDLYFASRKIGFYKLEGITDFSGMEEMMKTAAKLPQTTNTKPYTVVASKSHLFLETNEYILNLEKECGKVTRISKGSSLKLCVVAKGKADCYPRFAPRMEWDTAAGQAICLYAGKIVTDYEKREPMLYDRENLLNNWFLVN